MRIAIATFADLPNPASKGGAVETLIDDLCKQNEDEKRIKIDVYSVFDTQSEEMSSSYEMTRFLYYKKRKIHRFCIKNLVYKLSKKVLLDKNMRLIVKKINQERYDFVIITSIIREMQILASEIKSPVIWYLHGDPVSVLKKNDLKNIVEKCQGIITVSDFIKRRIESVSAECPVITVPNCGDVSRRSSDEENQMRCTFRMKHGIKKDDTLITYVGRITPIKGLLELINAFVVNNCEHMKLLIVGKPSNDYEESYYKTLKEKSNKNIIFVGYVEHSQLDEIYCASDVVAVPSICMEAAPLTIIEAMCFNKRIIATNVGGIPEYAYGKNVIFIEADEKIESSLQRAMVESQYKNNDIEEIDLERYSTKTYYNKFFEALIYLQ